MTDGEVAGGDESGDPPVPPVAEEPTDTSAHAPASAAADADTEAQRDQLEDASVDEPAASDAEASDPGSESNPPARRRRTGLQVSDDHRRNLAAVAGNFDNGVAAEMRRLQEAMRRATGVDRAVADLTRQLRASGVFEQIAGQQASILRAALRNAYPDPLAAEMERIRQAAADIARSAQPNAARLVAEQFRVLDRLTPQQLQPIEFAAAAQLARSVFANSGLEMWRVAQLARVDVARLADIQLPDINPAIHDLLASRTSVAADLAERLAIAAPDRNLTVATATSTRAWQRYLAVTDTPHEVQMSTAAGATVSGLIGGELLLHPADATDAEDIAGDLDLRVVEPWQRGAFAAREELFEALGRIDPDVVVFIQGGWDDVDRNGPAAASKIAHCAVEAVDHTLRALAPEADLQLWLHRDGRTPTEQEVANGRPTRRARLNYALRNRAGDAKLVQSQLDALVAQAGQLNAHAQKLKHAPGTATVTQARMVLVTAETLLMQLTIGY